MMNAIQAQQRSLESWGFLVVRFCQKNNFLQRFATCDRENLEDRMKTYYGALHAVA